MKNSSTPLKRLARWPLSVIIWFFSRLPKFSRRSWFTRITDKASARRAQALATSAELKTENGDVATALAELKKALAIIPERDEFEPLRIFQVLPALAVIELQGFGRYDAAQAYFQEIQDRQDRLATRLGLDLLRPDFDHRLYFGEFWTSHIGHLAALGAFVKRSILEGRLLRGISLALPPGKQPVNKALFAHWKKYGITVDQEVLPVPEWLLPRIEKKIFTFEYPDGLSRPYWESMAEVHRDWDKLGLPPLLSLTDAEDEIGREALVRLGLPADAWFVCLHVRAPGFKRSHEVLHAPLNADIDTYLPMIRAIADRGGWVIRLGDRSMPKLAPMENVIDYAHSASKSGTLDFYLSARCKFYVGTSSGLGFLPPLFGTRCVFTNWFPVGTRPFQPGDIYIPKLHRSLRANRLVPFAQTLAPPLGYIHSIRTLRKMGIQLVDNTPEEITEVVFEMYDQVMGAGGHYSEEDEALQGRFDDIARVSKCGGSARPGRAFLRRYEGLLVDA